jgi:hypothetical protein
VSSLALAGAISGAIGALTGVTSLGWQIRTSRREGHDVVVTCTNSFPIFNNPDGSQRMGDHMVTVAANNRGRSPVDVTGWGLQGPNKMTIYTANPVLWSTRLPHRLQPGSGAEFHVGADELRRTCREQGWPYKDVKGYVSLGDGTRRTSRKGVPLAD